MKGRKNKMSMLDKLFDENNEENITLYDDEGNASEFEQVALVPYEDKMYALLHPIDVEDCDEGEVVIFYIDEDEELLTVVEDESLADTVFEEFLKLLEDEDE